MYIRRQRKVFVAGYERKKYMSLQEIKVSREEVLNIVKENKEKHDGILKTAIEGYWLDADSYLKKFEKEEIEKYNKNHKAQLKQLRKNRKEYLKTLKTRVKEDLDRVKDRTRDKGFNYWRGTYPEDHGDDYLGTIRRLELCVDPEVKLDTHEFDAYIRNKWAWKDSFLNSNRGYVTSYALTSSYCMSNNVWPSAAVSASWSSCSYAISGSSRSLYGTGSLTVLNTF